MKRFIGEIIFHVFANVIALFTATSFVTGFQFHGDFVAMIITAAILTTINFFLKPVMKLLFGPLILLTLGLFLIVINSLTLFILDIFSVPLTIEGYIPLFYGTLIVTGVNIVLELANRWTAKKE